MIDEFVRSYKIFRERGLEDSLTEVLRLFDLVSGGTLSRIDYSHLEALNLDLEEIAEMRKRGVPMEYIVGRAIFMGLSFRCTPDTLIPRIDTELLVRSTIDLIEERSGDGRELTAIELGTGCGNIPISLAVNVPDVRILASDISPEAVEIARNNVEEYGLHDRIELFCGDLFDPFRIDDFRETIDIVVCNPPYIPTGSLRKLDAGITDHEPVLALDAGSYGIDIFRRLIRDSVPFLREGGALVFEIGAGQEKIVTRLLQKNGSYADIRHYDDGRDIRVIAAAKNQD